MLVLSRKNDQAVVIGGVGRLEDILKITVIKVDRGRVTLGIDAKTDVPVHREEVWARLCTISRSSRENGGPTMLEEELAKWADDGGAGTAPRKAMRRRPRGDGGVPSLRESSKESATLSLGENQAAHLKGKNAE